MEPMLADAIGKPLVWADDNCRLVSWCSAVIPFTADIYIERARCKVLAALRRNNVHCKH